MAVITTIRSVTGFLRLRDDGLADILDLTKTPTGQTQPLTADQQALITAMLADTAKVSQDSSVDALLAGAAQLLTDYAAARAALAAKITALPANATAAQLATFIKTDLAAYLVVDNDTQTKTIKGLANFISRQTGRTNTF